MPTQLLAVDPADPSPSAIAHAAAVLERGGLVVVPTETVYGLAARADDPDAVARIFEAKGRPAYNPLIVHVASVEEARSLASRWPDAAETLARAVWPGPLTLIVPRDRAKVPDGITAGGDTVGLRVPAHPVTLALLRALGRPFAAPSANRFQSVSPTTAAHAYKGLAGRVDLVLDGGSCSRGIESTVVDCTGEVPVLLRPGALPIARLRELVGEVRVREVHAEGNESPLRAPGMLKKHYAPRARLVVVRPEAIEDAARELGTHVAVVLRVSSAQAVRVPCAIHRLPDDAEGYAAALYATLHAVDDGGHDAVVVEAVPDGEAWAAVRDRLQRAES